jgi:predicted ATPase
MSSEVEPSQLLVGDDTDKANTRAEGLSDADRMLMDDLKLTKDTLQSSSIFTGAEEQFAFQRAVSRLKEMQSVQWIGTDLGL